MSYSTKKKKTGHKYNKKPYSFNEKMTDNISAIFLIYMFTVFPLFMDDGYLNITITKYKLFIVASVIYVVIAALLLILRFCDIWDSNRKNKVKDKRIFEGFFFLSDLFMLLFLLAGFFAWLMADNKKNAYTGEAGRRCGFAFVIVVALVYFAMSSGISLKKFIMPIFACSSVITYVISILQHFGIDAFGLLSKISSAQRNVFISTFGNINVFGSFVVLTMALFSGMFIFEENKYFKIIYAVVVFFGGGAIIASNSDVTYAGLIAYLIALLLVSLYSKKIVNYLFMLLITLAGYILMFLIINKTGVGLNKLTGINVTFNHIGFLAILFAVLLVISVICKLVHVKKQENKILPVIIASCVILILIIFICIFGIRNKWDLFEFNDYWGNYRGYVWNRLMTLYKDFPVLNKIFGNGNESIYELMYVNYYDEMYEITGTVYDSAHNQYLQYLVTMGILGVASYIGLIVTSVYNCIKASKNNIYAFPIMAAITGFAVQEFFNIGQPMTTPFIFLFMALAAALRRREFHKY